MLTHVSRCTPSPGHRMIDDRFIHLSPDFVIHYAEDGLLLAVALLPLLPLFVSLDAISVDGVVC